VLDPSDASALQKCVLDSHQDRDWLHRQCQRIAQALDNGELALAQIYGLHIPIAELDDRQLTKISLVKAGYDPDEPRIPEGQPHAGEWTTGGTGEAGRGEGDDGRGADAATSLAFESTAADSSSGANRPASAAAPPIKWEFRPLNGPPAAARDGVEPIPLPTTLDSPDLTPGVPAGSDPEARTGNPILDVPGIDAINPDDSSRGRPN
jgi:hypothetical protein